MTSGVQKSAVPTDVGLVNPVFGKVRYLMEQQPQLKALIRDMQQLAYSLGDRRGENFERFLSEAVKRDFKQRAEVIFRGYREVPEEPPVMGPPPPSNEVYGRFARGTTVVDVGSGNLSKVTPYSGSLKVIAVDPNLPNDKSKVVKQVRKPFGEFVFEEDYVISSFMSLCQLSKKEQELVEDRDGIHLVPDHTALIEAGAAHVEKDSTILVRTPLGTFRDNHVDAVGFPCEVGYKTHVTLRERDIDVKLLPEIAQQDYRPVSECTPIGFNEMNLRDIGYKFDGTFKELELADNRAYLVDRAGAQQIGATNFPDHLVLHLEQMNNCYVLLRVVIYRGMALPHCGDVLRRFVSRVKIRIDGLPVLGPPPWSPGAPHFEVDLPTDGLISRSDGRDNYVKQQWTVDLKETSRTQICQALEKKGMQAIFDPRPGLCEYAMDREGCKVFFRFLRSRHDKIQETSKESVCYMLNLPTLPEAYVLH